MSVEEYRRAREPRIAVSDVLSDNETIEEVPDAGRVELIDVTEKTRDHGDQPLVILTSTFNQAKNNLARYDDYALVIRRSVNIENIEISTTLEIRSHALRNALKECLVDYASLTLEAIPILIKKPYEALFHHRVALRKYANASERSEADKPHMTLFLDFMEKNLAASERLYNQLVPYNLINFELLWALFRVDDIILQQNDHYTEAYRVKSTRTRMEDNELVFEIFAWHWAFNGSKFGPSPETILIEHFQGPMKIKELHVYPMRVLSPEDQHSLGASFIRRGRKWKSLVDVTYGEYDGPIWVNPPDKKAETMAKTILNQGSGRIILDSQTFQMNNYNLATRLIGTNGIIRPRAEPSGSWLEKYYMEQALVLLIEAESDFSNGQCGTLSKETTHANTDRYQMTDTQALLCPARTSGFALVSKKWACFLVDEVRDVIWRDDAFEKLELGPENKSAIEALVKTHTSTGLHFDDFIKDKGKGLVLLLYGPPGSGKTLTAETIAELTHRPLYYIGAAELGTNVEEAENALKHVFELSKTWNAILLLDEADVFLSKRTKDDIVRNAFVAVFLRLLEYYQGILFLTTNRLAEFDAAFESRIHLSVEYSPLTPSQRSNIWQNLLSMVPDCKDWSTETYEKIGQDLELNGRSIKNLIKTSLAIARHGNATLTEDHLRLVYRLNYKSSQNWRKGDNATLDSADCYTLDRNDVPRQ